MARASWTGEILFGLVSIPVRLERATISQDVHFHLVHDKDGGRIQHKRVCAVDGEEVPLEEVAKGYELSDGEQVMVSRDDLALLESYGQRTIAIEDFVEAREVDPLYLKSTYYVAPDDSLEAKRSYELLRMAMAKAGRVAIARITMRMRTRLCLLSAESDTLALTTLHYSTEIVTSPEIDVPAQASPAEAEIAMAEQLIDSMTTRFRAERYRDDYREHLVALLQHKSSRDAARVQTASDPMASLSIAERLAASLRATREGPRTTPLEDAMSAPH